MTRKTTCCTRCGVLHSQTDTVPIVSGLTVRVRRDKDGIWVARVRLDDGNPACAGNNMWITQGDSPTEAVFMASDLLRLVGGECRDPRTKHRWRRARSKDIDGKLGDWGWWCGLCRTWTRRRGGGA
jgi:hypothetical protein